MSSASSSSSSSSSSLALLNAHPRDRRVTFESRSHTYTVDGKQDYISCTTFLKQFSPVFDADAVLKKMMPKVLKDPFNKYHGMSVEQIKKQWEQKGKDASVQGTKMHSLIEAFYNKSVIPQMQTALPEFKHFLCFNTDFGCLYNAFNTEKVMFGEQEKWCGQADIIFEEPETGNKLIFDWKRVETLQKENKWQKMLPPLQHLECTNYNTYALQVNIYRYILMKYYDYTITGLYVVLLHPANKTYYIEKMPFMDHEMELLVQHRLKELKANQKMLDEII